MYEYLPPISFGFAGLCYLIAGVVCALRAMRIHAAAQRLRNPRHILEAWEMGCAFMDQARDGIQRLKVFYSAYAKRRVVVGILLAVIGLGGLLTDFLRMW